MWSLDEYCQSELARQSQLEDWSQLPEASLDFLQSFQLPTMHPFCEATKLDDFFVAGIPPMGPLEHADYHHHVGDVIVTHLFRVLPALLAMAELWLRLFASIIAPLGIAYMLYQGMTTSSGSNNKPATWKLSVLLILTVASSIVLMTDTLYVLEYGPRYGLLLFVVSSSLALNSCSQHQLTKTLGALVLLKVLAAYLVFHHSSTGKNNLSFGNPVDAVRHIQEGLYYNTNNPFIRNIVDAWPENSRTYSKALGATPWMPTGDSRTGLPFLLNKGIPSPIYHRIWLETYDHEYVALDIALPSPEQYPQGHSSDKPLYLVLHGLNGGSREEYVMEFVHRRIAEGSTVVVMVARGLMDLPIKGWNIFHGARTEDVTTAAKALRQVKGVNQLLAGVGYSMGAIILSNYVARIGDACALDAAVAISGGLDMRFEHKFFRAQRLWQPMLAKELRDTFLVNKWGERVRARLSLDDMKRSMRAVHVTEIDEHAVAPYNRFDNVTHYYMEMSALGDVPLEAYKGDALPSSARIHDISIPFCVVHALDDPLVTWRTVAADEGLLHPANLTASVRSGNLLLLLTKAGGHVGWPLGWTPYVDKWKWMNDAAMTFVEAVKDVSKQPPGQCTNPNRICDSPPETKESPSTEEEQVEATNSDDLESSQAPAEKQEASQESSNTEEEQVESTNMDDLESQAPNQKQEANEEL